MRNVITFDKNAKKDILDIFNKNIDEEGFIVEKNDPKQRVLASDGEEIEAKDLAAIKKGSLVFVKSDINSIIELADSIKE